LNGLAYIVSIDAGCVLDCVIKTKVFHVCKANPNVDAEWKKEHAKDCYINHSGSSGTMEVNATVEMFLLSVDSYNLHNLC